MTERHEDRQTFKQSNRQTRTSMYLYLYTQFDILPNFGLIERGYVEYTIDWRRCNGLLEEIKRCTLVKISTLHVLI